MADRFGYTFSSDTVRETREKRRKALLKGIDAPRSSGSWDQGIGGMLQSLPAGLAGMVGSAASDALNLTRLPTAAAMAALEGVGVDRDIARQAGWITNPVMQASDLAFAQGDTDEAAKAYDKLVYSKPDQSFAGRFSELASETAPKFGTPMAQSFMDTGSRLKESAMTTGALAPLRAAFDENYRDEADFLGMNPDANPYVQAAQEGRLAPLLIEDIGNVAAVGQAGGAALRGAARSATAGATRAGMAGGVSDDAIRSATVDAAEAARVAAANPEVGVLRGAGPVETQIVQNVGGGAAEAARRVRAAGSTIVDDAARPAGAPLNRVDQFVGDRLAPYAPALQSADELVGGGVANANRIAALPVTFPLELARMANRIPAVNRAAAPVLQGVSDSLGQAVKNSAAGRWMRNQFNTEGAAMEKVIEDHFNATNRALDELGVDQATRDALIYARMNMDQPYYTQMNDVLNRGRAIAEDAGADMPARANFVGPEMNAALQDLNRLKTADPATLPASDKVRLRQLTAADDIIQRDLFDVMDERFAAGRGESKLPPVEGTPEHQIWAEGRRANMEGNAPVPAFVQRYLGRSKEYQRRVREMQKYDGPELAEAKVWADDARVEWERAQAAVDAVRGAGRDLTDAVEASAAARRVWEDAVTARDRLANDWRYGSDLAGREYKAERTVEYADLADEANKGAAAARREADQAGAAAERARGQRAAVEDQAAARAESQLDLPTPEAQAARVGQLRDDIRNQTERIASQHTDEVLNASGYDIDGGLPAPPKLFRYNDPNTGQFRWVYDVPGGEWDWLKHGTYAEQVYLEASRRTRGVGSTSRLSIDEFMDNWARSKGIDRNGVDFYDDVMTKEILPRAEIVQAAKKLKEFGEFDPVPFTRFGDDFGVDPKYADVLPEIADDLFPLKERKTGGKYRGRELEPNKDQVANVASKLDEADQLELEDFQIRAERAAADQGIVPADEYRLGDAPYRMSEEAYVREVLEVTDTLDALTDQDGMARPDLTPDEQMLYEMAAARSLELVPEPVFNRLDGDGFSLEGVHREMAYYADDAGWANPPPDPGYLKQRLYNPSDADIAQREAVAAGTEEFAAASEAGLDPTAPTPAAARAEMARLAREQSGYEQKIIATNRQARVAEQARIRAQQAQEAAGQRFANAETVLEARGNPDPGVLRKGVRAAERELDKAQRQADAQQWVDDFVAKAEADPQNWPADLRTEMEGLRTGQREALQLADKMDELGRPADAVELREAAANAPVVFKELFEERAVRPRRVIAGKEGEGAPTQRQKSAGRVRRTDGELARDSKQIAEMSYEGQVQETMRRWQQQNENLVAREMADKFSGEGAARVQRMFDEGADPADVIEQMRADGFRPVDPESLRMVKTSGKNATEIRFEGTATQRPHLWMTKGYADALDGIMRQADSTPNRAVAIFDKGQNLWKMSVLPFSPKWNVGNVFGNMLLVAGTVHLRDFTGENWRAVTKGIRDPDLMQARLLKRGSANADVGSVLGPDAPAARGGFTRRGLRKFADKMYAANAWVDDASHLMIYTAKKAENTAFRNQLLENLQAGRITKAAYDAALDPAAGRLGGGKKTWTDEQAVKEALDFAGDFSNMSYIEQNYIRRAIPFYAWYRHMTELAYKLPTKNPYRTAWALHLGDMFSDDENVPAWLRGGLKVGETYVRAPWNPYPTATPGQSPLTNPVTALGSTTPWLQWPAAAFGLSMQRGGDVTRAPGDTPLDSEGNPMKAAFIGFDNLLGYVSKQNPAVNTALEMIDPGKARYDTRQEVRRSGRPVLNQQILSHPEVDGPIKGRLGPLIQFMTGVTASQPDMGELDRLRTKRLRANEVAKKQYARGG